MKKIEYPTAMQLEILRLGLGLVGIGIEDKKVLAKIWIVSDQIREYGADFNLRDAVDIEELIDKKYKPKKVTAHATDSKKPNSAVQTGGSNSDSAGSPAGNVDTV